MESRDALLPAPPDRVTDFRLPFLNGGQSYESTVRPGPLVAVAAYLAANWQHSSLLEWEERVDAGLVELNGAVATRATLVRGEDRLVYRRRGWLEPAIPAIAGLAHSSLLPIIHEDAHVLAVCKPSGLPVMIGGLYLERTVLRLLGGPQRVAPVQRLGRGTSGLLLLAKEKNAAQLLTEAFRSRTMGKEYLALLQGAIAPAGPVHVTEPIVCMEALQGALSGAHQAHWWLAASAAAAPLKKKARPSDSTFYVLGHGTAPVTGAPYTLCRVAIGTGRAHQIRIHSAFLGHPLLGDPLYVAGGGVRASALAESGDDDEDDQGEGQPSLPSSIGYFLHSWHAKLPAESHPDGRPLDLYCPLPASWDAYIKELRWTDEKPSLITIMTPT